VTLQVLEFSRKKIQDFPGSVGTLSKCLQKYAKIKNVEAMVKRQSHGMGCMVAKSYKKCS